MTDITDPEEFESRRESVEDITAGADVKKSAWERTLEEMEGLAAEYEERGWEVASVGSIEVTPKPSTAGDSDDWGLIHVLSDNDVESFLRVFQLGEFPEYQVYRREIEGDVFLVTELTDADAEAAILLAGGYNGMHAVGLVGETKEVGHLYTHVQTLDGTRYATFRHEEPEKFFPRYDEFGDRFGMEHSLDGEE